MSIQESDFIFQPTLDDVGRPLSQTTFVVVDLETTGGSPIDSKITEFGAVKVRGGEILGEFKTFVNPEMPIPAYITVLTGITDAMVVEAPTIAEIFPNFLAFCGSEKETVLVAHNAPFDLGFLKANAKELGYNNDARQVGVSAQEVEAVLPEVVATRGDGIKAVKYEKIIALLIESVKELHKEVKKLKEKFDYYDRN